MRSGIREESTEGPKDIESITDNESTVKGLNILIKRDGPGPHKYDRYLPPEPKESDMFAWFKWIRESSLSNVRRDILVQDTCYEIYKHVRNWTDFRKNSFPIPRANPMLTQKRIQYPPSIEDFPQYQKHAPIQLDDLPKEQPKP